MQHKIADMVELQNSLNIETNGEDWVYGVTDKGKLIRWWLCINMEVSELIDSAPWKHWKGINGEIDLANIKIEATDIWHFVMSAVIEYKLGNVEEAIELIEEGVMAYSDNYTSINLTLDNVKDSVGEDQQLNIMVDYLIDLISNMYSNKKLDNDAEAITLVLNFMMNMHVISRISQMMGEGLFELDQLYKLYIGKNVLNKFRQDNGYKEGSYVKIWNGLEDNVIMTKMLDDNDDITFNQLYDMLTEYYSQL